ncbi:MAG: glycerol-3-phosphate dehydrogenase/oxidase [Chitinophagales bacterium]|nr:glycerol-3-phosphate dehydrogenase/oxidase [Chitinophagales bacterium]
MNRIQSIEKAQSESFDICIIGGGITGAGIFHHAVEKGYKTILIDKGDFASGTSSRSSKMIHGGLRYLKNLQVGLVREALLEREHLLKLFPHLVKPIQYIIPIYGSTFEKIKLEIGLSLYDKLSGDSQMPKHQNISQKEVLKYFPKINTKNLKGGIRYWDAKTNDARLVLESIANTVEKGGMAINYCKAVDAVKKTDKVESLTCHDEIGDTLFSIQSKIYISATGVWTDELLQKIHLEEEDVMQPSKGAHVLISSNKFPSDIVAVINTGSDDRFIYNLPWDNNLTILGTTDTEYKNHPETVITERQDVDYIVQVFNKKFPDLHLNYEDIVAVYAGLRPILSSKKDLQSTERSREYKIWWNNKNTLTIAGGKLTSFLSMGIHCMQMAEERLEPGTNGVKNFLPKVSKKWKEQYGLLGAEIEEMIRQNPEKEQVFHSSFKYTIAEMEFFITTLFAQTLEDICSRRTYITFSMTKINEDFILRLAQFMAEKLNKDETWINAQIADYSLKWKDNHPDFLKTS